MTDLPFVSCIVVNWNRRELLRSCLDSLRAQRGIRLEIVVVDNGSRDGSLEMLEIAYSEAQVVRNSRNRGFCFANNQGFAVAKGEFLAVLNNDAEIEPGFLAALAQVFDGHPDVGMAASKIVVFEDSGMIDKVGHVIYPDGQNRGRGTGERDMGQYDRIEEVLWPDGCAAMYRRAMIKSIGGFDEDLFAYGDDAELGLRARIAGWRCLYTPYAVARHRRGSTLGKASIERLRLIERNRVLLAVKLFPWSLLALNPYYYFLRLWAGAGAAVRGEGEAALFPGIGGKIKLAAGLLWGDLCALPWIPKTLVKRKEFSPLRKLTPAQVKALILENGISLQDLSTKAAIP